MGKTKLAKAQKTAAPQPIQAAPQLRSRPFEAAEPVAEESGLPSHQFEQIAIQSSSPPSASPQSTKASAGLKQSVAAGGGAQVQRSTDGVDIQPLVDDPVRTSQPLGRPTTAGLTERSTVGSSYFWCPRTLQLLIMKDATAAGAVRLYEPEVTDSGQHLVTLASNGAGLETYFRDLTDIEIYGYIQILGKVTSSAPPSP